MTSDGITPQPSVPTFSYVDMVVSCQGEIPLAAERLSTIHGRPITDYEVRQGFIEEITEHPNKLASIRALALLQSLQLMQELHLNTISALNDFSPAELLKAFDAVAHSIAELTTQPVSAPGDNGGNTNTYNFNGDSIVDRLAGQLAKYALQPAQQLIEANAQEA